MDYKPALNPIPESPEESTEGTMSLSDSQGVGIDLSLAVNYLPAVECVGKGVFMCFLLVVIPPGEHMGAFTIIALILNVDRVLSTFRIFDGNCLLCTLLASHVVNYLRMETEELRGAAFALSYIAVIVWILSSLVILIEPEFYTEYLSSKALLRQAHAAVWTGFGVASVAFTHLDQESTGVKFMRSLGFLLLSVAWVYVVGVWKRVKVSSQLLVAKFCPVLFVNFILGVIYCVFSFGFLIYCYTQGSSGVPRFQAKRQAPQASSQHSDYSKCVAVTVDQGLESNLKGSMDDEEEDLEVFFHMACQAKGVSVSSSEYGTETLTGRIGSPS